MALLRNLTESAFVVVLNGSNLGVPVYPGIAGTDKDGPCVKVRAVSAEEDPIGSGNYRVAINIIAAYPARGDTSGFDTLCTALRNGVCNDGIVTGLNAAAPGLMVYGVSTAGKVDWDTVEDCWTESHTVEIYAALTAP